MILPQPCSSSEKSTATHPPEIAAIQSRSGGGQLEQVLERKRRVKRVKRSIDTNEAGGMMPHNRKNPGCGAGDNYFLARLAAALALAAAFFINDPFRPSFSAHFNRFADRG